MDARSRLTRAAMARIDAGYLNDHSVEDLAAGMSVSARHLRRVLRAELGVSPVELAQTRRLAIAKQLLQDTTLSVTDVAFGSGFSSIRRFNALFIERFRRSPSSIRGMNGERDEAEDHLDAFSLRLGFRPPLDWSALLAFLSRRAIDGIERIEGDVFSRFVVSEDRAGWVRVVPSAARSELVVSLPIALAPEVTSIVSGLRRLFDLDAHPQLIAEHLGGDATLAPLVEARPGLRVPGAFDSFELAVRTVLGQQISVRAASRLCDRLVAVFGREVTDAGPRTPGHARGRVFPSAREVTVLPVESVRAIGLPLRRAHTVVELSRAIAEGRVDLSAEGDPESLEEVLGAVSGIGPWTTQYIAMRALRWPNAFPSGDLGLRKALGLGTGREVEERARSWAPWRAYAALHLWHHLSLEHLSTSRSTQRGNGTRPHD